ncbi:lactonase [Leptospira mtsangambouensis]|uniref:lactonase n=1 Tax=Leptospira mtsangambouensis TaxID=2484912 RepID=UPI001EEBC635|nr:lactonase [Leptospira mtsangambouensis]MCG6142583.1 lactonase [Leptospira mtsangambouensis]
MKKIAYLLLLLCFGCTQFLLPKSKINSAWYLVLSVIGISANDGELPPPVDIVSQPNLALPTGTFFESPDVSVSVNASKIEIPSQIGSLNVPIGKVYDIDLKVKLSEEIESTSIKSFVFSEPVVLEYSYNREELESAGFLEEFQVFYFSKISNQWEPLREIVVDQEKGKIFAKTDHFTPFILTAVPKLAGTGVAAAPACLSTEMPISGSSGAVWTQINEHFKYYKDRNYTLISNNDFSTLDFSGAYGIATCNGGAPSPNTDDCGPFSQHKYYDGNEYIKFTASEDITVYVMYDSRGSQDATWLAINSWALTDKQIATTDGVGYYKVYQKQFLKNEVVTMHGNRQGIPANAGVETNYWVVVKPNNVGGTCLTQSSYGSIQQFFLLTLAIAGSESATFLWTNNKDPRFENIIVRRKKNFPPTSVEDGVAPNVSEIEDIGFRETGLDLNSTYYYAIFARNADGILSLPDIYRIDTGLDSDNDGITDIIESSSECLYKPWHDYNCNSNPSLADSDGDGKDDLNELIYNTKMDSSDISPPVISKFELLSKPISSLPYGIFYFEAEESTNTEFRYIITNSPIKPNPTSFASSIPPDRILGNSSWNRLGGDGISTDFYLWIKDAAGNISMPAGPIRVTQSGYQRPSYIAGWSPNLANFSLQSLHLSGDLVNADSAGITTSVSEARSVTNLKWGKIPRVFYVAAENTNKHFISVFTSESNPSHLLQRIYVPGLLSFIIADDGRNLYTLDMELDLRISKYQIQTDGTLIFDKKSATIGDFSTGFDMVYNGFNQSIYLPDYQYLKPITRINAETLEKDESPKSLLIGNFEWSNFRFHPGGKFCYFINPGGEKNIARCEFDPSNGNITFKDNVLEVSDRLQNFEITADGNYMVVVSADYPQLQLYNFVLYRIDKPTGNLIETDRKVLTSYRFENKLKIDQSSHFVFFLNNDNQINYYIINQNNGKFYGPIVSNLSGYKGKFEIQSAEYARYQIQTNIEHLNQAGFVQGYNDVKYPLPFVSLVGDFTNNNLVNRAIRQPIQIGLQNKDLNFMTCGKKESDYEETIEIKNHLGQDKIQNISGTIWNRTISIQNLVSDISFSGRYRLNDLSSNCKPNQPQSFADISVTKKRISPVYVNLKLPSGQKPADIDAFTSLLYTQDKGIITPYTFYRTTCTIHEYGCNFIKVDGPFIFFCHWHDTTKVFQAYKNKDQCYEKEPNARRLFHLTLITNVDHSIETSWYWNKYKITEP